MLTSYVLICSDAFRFSVSLYKETQIAQFDRGHGVALTIRRGHLVEDAYAQCSHLGLGLKGRIRVSFISDEGLPEAGIDGGGLFKEFLTHLCKQVKIINSKRSEEIVCNAY